MGRVNVVLWWVSAPWATFGVEVRSGIVITAAPIARWMVGKSWWSVCRPWLLEKGARIQEVVEIRDEPGQS